MSTDTEKAQVKSMLLAWAAKSGAAPTEAELTNALMALKPVFGPNLRDADTKDLVDEIAKVFAINMDLGVVIEAEDHKPWLESRRTGIDWHLWNAYTQFLLNSGRGPVVMDKMNSSLDTILDHLGDPFDLGPWNRRGLVIGDVQSGKTATYIGLMDKAADAGYRIFIILTGNTESLRQQTQARIDEGMLGQDTKPLVKGAPVVNKPAAVGIGLLADLQNPVASMTTMTTDFRKTGLEAIAFRPGPDTLMVFATKKNKTVLDNIAKWLDSQHKHNGKIQVPLLFLDDEADYASVNTNKDDDDPTAINQAIRKILNTFARSSYVGFTATPFANIFIDDDDTEDLFPRDFIYGLEAPSNYVGPRSLFGGDDGETDDKSVRELDDAEDYFPLGHKNQLHLSGLPESLKEALRTFLIANAIRDLIGQRGAPRSMLVNVSRFNLVQAQLGKLLEDELAGYRNAIRLHSKMFATGVPNDELSRLQKTFETEFADQSVTWELVLRELPASVAEIQVRVMNAKRDKEYEDKQLRAEAPPRTIAVGGDLLSRGLTLDGLMTSYFYRRVAASDTLMQMGRWFGYRDSYSSLTRVWITPELVSDYASTADTLAELRIELLRMRDEKLTPTQYGLAVKSHPSALLITARNKMRSAALGEKSVSLRGRAIETYKISSLPVSLEKNGAALEHFVEQMQAGTEIPQESPVGAARVKWEAVDKYTVADFLDSYSAPSRLPLFAGGALSTFVRGALADDLQDWDVALIGGSGEPKMIGGISIKQARRALGPGESVYTVSDTKHRLAGPGDVSLFMSNEQKAKAVTAFRALYADATKNVPDRAYIAYLKRPVLLIYPVEGHVDPKYGLNGIDPELVGILIAIPERKGSDGLEPAAIDRSGDVKYMLNAPAQRLWAQDLLGFGDGDADE